MTREVATTLYLIRHGATEANLATPPRIQGRRHDSPLARLGAKVPDSLSVVGYDDSMLARLAHVNLTTVSQDARGQADQVLGGGRVHVADQRQRGHPDEHGDHRGQHHDLEGHVLISRNR